MVVRWRLVMVAAVVAVAGCGGSSESSVIPLSSVTATQSYQAARDGVAKDYTRVALGTPVLVEIGSSKSKRHGTMEITVTSVDMGSWTDLGETETADPDGNVPFYLRATIKNVGTTDLSGATPDLLQGLLADGRVATNLTVFGYPDDQCVPAFVTDTQFKPGMSYQTCTSVLANPAIPIVAVQWINEYFGTKSIIWSQ